MSEPRAVEITRPGTGGPNSRARIRGAMSEAANVTGASEPPAANPLPLRRLVRRTHLPAVLGLALSLVMLLCIALVMTLRVEPRLHHLREAADAASRAHDAMLDQETGVRGYLATGAREFLQPYVDGTRAGTTRTPS